MYVVMIVAEGFSLLLYIAFNNVFHKMSWISAGLISFLCIVIFSQFLSENKAVFIVSLQMFVPMICVMSSEMF